MLSEDGEGDGAAVGLADDGGEDTVVVGVDDGGADALTIIVPGVVEDIAGAADIRIIKFKLDTDRITDRITAGVGEAALEG